MITWVIITYIFKNKGFMFDCCKLSYFSIIFNNKYCYKSCIVMLLVNPKTKSRYNDYNLV
jgi:hypothetical protein